MYHVIDQTDIITILQCDIAIPSLLWNTNVKRLSWFLFQWKDCAASCTTKLYFSEKTHWKMNSTSVVVCCKYFEIGRMFFSNVDMRLQNVQTLHKLSKPSVRSFRRTISPYPSIKLNGFGLIFIKYHFLLVNNFT